jgi:hypothetical protein
MKAFLKIIVNFIMIVFLLSAIGIFWVASSVKAMQAVLKAGAGLFLKDITVQELVIKKQICRFPKEFIFEDVSFRLKHKAEDFDLSFKAIAFSELIKFLSAQEGASLEFKEGSVASSVFQIHGLTVHLVSQGAMNWIGTVNVDKAESNGFEVKNIQAKAVVRREDATLFDIQAYSYEGQLKGIAQVYFIPLVRYVANLTFENLETIALEKLNTPFFSQIRGQVYGTIHVKGPAGGLEKIAMNVMLADGGKIQAQMLSPLLNYIPMSTQSKILQTAIEQKQLMSIDSGRLTLSNKDAEKIITGIQLKSKDLNLDVNVTVDIMIDGGLKRLLDNLNQLSLLMKGT